jgi:hypothetical protein
MMITLYLDMDGVVANFDKAYRAYDPMKEDRKKFRSSVMDYKIFEDLEPMPNAQMLLRHVAMLRDVRVEMLTSKGTYDTVQGAEAERQKHIWLKKHGILYKANFVRSKEEKAKYATPFSILIDDSIGCITPFNVAGGHGILHSDSSMRETLLILDNLLLQIRALQALRQ